MTYSGSMLTPSKLQLHLNGQVIADFGAEGNDVVVGFSCLMAAYYVFSVKYPSKIAKTLLHCYLPFVRSESISIHASIIDSRWIHFVFANTPSVIVGREISVRFEGKQKLCNNQARSRNGTCFN
jgi:hypothetical protein